MPKIQVQEQVKACHEECKTSSCKRRCRSAVKELRGDDEPAPSHKSALTGGTDGDDVVNQDKEEGQDASVRGAQKGNGGGDDEPAPSHKSALTGGTEGDDGVRQDKEEGQDASVRGAQKGNGGGGDEVARSGKVGLMGLRNSDLALLRAAQKDQEKEIRMRQERAAALHSALKSGRHASVGFGGDWAPGMRSGALKGLRRERREARQTAIIAQRADGSDVW